MKLKIYIDTSVISYFTANQSADVIQRAHQEITKLWWKNFDQNEFYISTYVIEEIEKGYKEAAEKRLKAVERCQILDPSQVVERFAVLLLRELGIPDRSRLDAFHLAVAALNNQDYIVSWNFKHMANARVRRINKTICLSEGLVCPDISTPEEMLGEGENI